MVPIARKDNVFLVNIVVKITFLFRFRTVERLPRISRGLSDIDCSENDCVTFECKLNITQETDVRWQKDGKVFVCLKTTWVIYIIFAE